MANNFDDLILDTYEAMDRVSRELVGFVPAVTRNFAAERAAKGQNVLYHVAPAMSAADVSPAMQVPEPDDLEITGRYMAMTRDRDVSFGYTGEEQRGVNNGTSFSTVQADVVAQAIRTLANEVERDLAQLLASTASRAYGTPGTTPFDGGDTEDAAAVRKILVDNGAPGDRQLVINTTTGVKLAKAIGFNANRQDITNMNDQGVIVTPHGMQIRESGAHLEHEAGDADGATTNSDGYAVGSTSITLSAAGTGEIKAGDLVTFAGDDSKYLVKTGLADVSAGGTIEIQEPGLMVSIPAETTAVSVVDDFAINAAFSRSAVHLVARAPALPDGRDAAVNRTVIRDPRSGLAFDLAEYAGFRKTSLRIGLVWGFENVAPRHSALLIG